MDAFNARDADAALVHMHPDIRFHPVSARALGREEPFVGHAGMREYLEMTEREWASLRLEAVQVQEARNAVTVLGRTHGRGRGGGVLDTNTLWTWKLRDGLVTECRVHADTAKARAALGLD